MIKKNGSGKGEEMMWQSVAVISDFMEKHLADDAKAELMADVYGLMSEGHYNEDYAHKCVEKMYYAEGGEKVYAPYWSDQQLRAVYEKVSPKIPESYTFWDFYVTMNMIASDDYLILHKWFPNMDADMFTAKVTDLAVSWLDDPDNPYGESKIWGYMHAQ